MHRDTRCLSKMELYYQASIVERMKLSMCGVILLQALTSIIGLYQFHQKRHTLLPLFRLPKGQHEPEATERRSITIRCNAWSRQVFLLLLVFHR